MKKALLIFATVLLCSWSSSAQTDTTSMEDHIASIDGKIPSSFWHRSPAEGILASISFVAAIVTIIGLGVLANDYWSRRINKKYQKRIMEDRIRLLYTNLVSLEVIRLKMESFHYENCSPHSSIFPRFCFTESEMDMNRFSISAKQYDHVHRFEKTLRNYNLAAMTAAAHFADKSVPRSVKEYDLENLRGRTTRLICKILELCGRRFLNIGEIDVEDCVRNHYALRDTYFPNEESWELTEKENAIPGIDTVKLISENYNVIDKIGKDGKKIFKAVQMFPGNLEGHFRKAVANRYLTPNDTNVAGPKGIIL